MLKTNEKKLVQMLLQCQPGPPATGRSIAVDMDGKPFDLPSIGGIVLNIEVGDSAFGWEGDHIEPGVSCRWGDKPFEHPNNSLQVYGSCGNQAEIISGKAKGKKGVVIGQHGGSEHTIIDFDRKAKEQLTYDDKIIIKCVGPGLRLVDYPEVMITGLDPSLLKKLKIKEDKKNKKLKIPVTTIVPSVCMGSGIGSTRTTNGDYDIMTSDQESMEKYKLDQIKFGDFVAIMDQDNRFGRTYRKGAVTIGIVIHSDCKFAGHGPGVTTLLTSIGGEIEPVIDKNANIANLLNIGSKRKSTKRGK